MSFKLFLIWTFILLGRPQDLMVALQPFRPALVFAVLSAGSSLFGLKGDRLPSLLHLPETKKYVLFYLIMILGIPMAFHRRMAFDFIMLTYLVNVLYFLVFVLEVNSFQKLKTVLFVISLCSLLYGVFGLMNGTFMRGRFTIYGGMFDPNDIAYVLISLFPLSLYFIFRDEGIIKRIIATVGVFTSLLVVLYSGSRGGMLGLMGIAVFFLIAKSEFIGNRHKIITVIFMVILVIAMISKIDIDRYRSLADISGDYNISDEWGRVQIWGRAIDLLLSNPITGVGVECSAMAIGYAREALGIIPRWQVVHNSYLQIAAETGLIAFFIFLALIMGSYKTFWRYKTLAGSNEEIAEMRAIAGVVFLGFIGQLITAFFLSQGYSIYFTLFFALAVSLKQISAHLINQTEAASEARVVNQRADAHLL